MIYALLDANQQLGAQDLQVAPRPLAVAPRDAGLPRGYHEGTGVGPSMSARTEGVKTRYGGKNFPV